MALLIISRLTAGVIAPITAFSHAAGDAYFQEVPMSEPENQTPEVVNAPPSAPGTILKLFGIICMLGGIAFFIFISGSEKSKQVQFAIFAAPAVLFAIFGAILFVGGELKRTLYDLIPPPYNENQEEQKP